MPIKIDLSSDICPSCGFKKDVDMMPVCFYCYYRGTQGTAKMYALLVLKNAGERLNIQEVMCELNDCKINGGRREYKYVGTQQLLNKMAGNGKMYNILSKSHTRNGKVGRPVVHFKFHVTRAERFLTRYLKRWDFGMPVRLPFKKNPATWEGKHKQEIRKKSRAISNKLRMHEYDRFDFIFPDGMKNNPKFHVRKVDECINPDVLYQQPHSSLCQTSRECCVTEDQKEYVVDPK